MYIKIGNTNIKYLTSQDDFMIVSEVIDSSLSYEKPVLVRTSDELDIWFGRSFSDRDYLSELLEMGVTLFLYKPVRDELNNKSDNFIDYYFYEEDPILYYNEIEFPEIGRDKVKYKLISDTGSEIDEKTQLRFDYWIYINNNYINTKLLPQNLNLNNTISLNNRDVLSINYNNYVGPKYVYPEYQDNYYNNSIIYLNENIDEELLLSNLPNLNRVNLNYETLSYDIEFSDNIDFGINSSESPYIIIPTIDSNVMIYFNSGLGIPTSVSTKYYNSSKEILVTDNREEIINNFLSIISEYGYNYIKNSELTYQIYTSYKTNVTYFYNLMNFSMNPNFNKTHDILSNISKNDRRIEFFSKTIGTDEDNLIKVRIEKLNNDYYRITISRFDYSEVFEGSIFDKSDRIDYKINNESKLVRCNLIETYINSSGNSVRYSSEDTERDSSLPEGEWELRRGYVEDYNPSMYWKSVESVFNDGDTILFDYFLVPNIKKYTSGLDPDYSYYTEYIKFLDYAKLINCQILIQNSDSNWVFEYVESLPEFPQKNIVYSILQESGGYKFYILNEITGNLEETVDREIINTYGNEYAFNYTKDIENRLIYFYRPMTVLNNSRPGYYVFLDGLLKDNYSSSVQYINYNCPIKDPYNDDNTIEDNLIKFKSNYLVDNNQIYFYKKYQNGVDYVTSVWMRFCIGKISRELEKNKWGFLGEKLSGNIRNKILEILNKISGSFTIIRRLSLTKFNINYQEYKIELTIEVYMSDLVNNNINLDITLNYNK